MLRKLISITLLFVFLISCSNSAPISTPTIISTIIPNTPSPTPTLIPTIIPTATPYGGGSIPRIAIFTESEPDETAAGYIRIGNIDLDKTKFTFGDIKLRVGTKPSNLPDYFEGLPPDISWSPNGIYLAYTWAEDGKALIYIYDYATQKIKWELELTDKNFQHVYENDIAWAADSNWLYVKTDVKSHYILDVKNGEINNLADNFTQTIAWQEAQTSLCFENSTGKYFQYDPVGNQILQIEPVKFDPTKFDNIASWDEFGYFNQNNNGYLFVTSNKDNSRSIYLESADNPIFELLKIESSVPRDSVGRIDQIISSPDKSYYLVAGTTQKFLNDNYAALFTSFSIKTQYPLTIDDIGGANGIYPYYWSPDGKSYIGYQYAYEKNVFINPDQIVKIVIVDAEKNSVIKEYEINRFKTHSIYGYILNTSLFDSSGPTGVDVYWQ